MSSRGCKPTERARLRHDPAGVEYELIGGQTPAIHIRPTGVPRMPRVPAQIRRLVSICVSVFCAGSEQWDALTCPPMWRRVSRRMKSRLCRRTTRAPRRHGKPWVPRDGATVATFLSRRIWVRGGC